MALRTAFPRRAVALPCGEYYYPSSSRSCLRRICRRPRAARAARAKIITKPPKLISRNISRVATGRSQPHTANTKKPAQAIKLAFSRALLFNLKRTKLTSFALNGPMFRLYQTLFLPAFGFTEWLLALAVLYMTASSALWCYWQPARSESIKPTGLLDTTLGARRAHLDRADAHLLEMTK